LTIPISDPVFRAGVNSVHPEPTIHNPQPLHAPPAPFAHEPQSAPRWAHHAAAAETPASADTIRCEVLGLGIRV